MVKTNFGKTKDGREISLYTIEGKGGMKLSVTDYGATVQSILVADKNGKMVDVALGYDNGESYEREACYFGATVGRSANRIANAKCTIDGVEYQLQVNDNENNLHSGDASSADQMWSLIDSADNKLTFQFVSKDMEQGFPGNCDMKVTYTLTDKNELEIQYDIVSDKKTVINPTNHTYFNLNGQETGSVHEHSLQLKASHYTPVKSNHAIPTGEKAAVEGTPFDFTTMKKIGRDITIENDQLTYGNGYDHNFAIDKDAKGVEKVATAIGDQSGIQMEVLTDLPGIQLYTGNFITGQHGKNGVTYVQRGGFCLETQYFPNSVNEPNFESPIYDAGEKYNHKTVYAFSISK